MTEWALPDLDLWALFPAGRLVGAKARAFTSFVEARLASDAASQGRPG